LVAILKICGIATGYAKKNMFKRGRSLLDSRLSEVVGNLLKSLGPNDKLTTAVMEMDVLLKAETSIVSAQINKRTFEMKTSLERVEETTSATQAGMDEVREKVTSLLEGKGQEHYFVTYQ
jgi:hypothetical protein